MPSGTGQESYPGRGYVPETTPGGGSSMSLLSFVVERTLKLRLARIDGVDLRTISNVYFICDKNRIVLLVIISLPRDLQKEHINEGKK